ncbi:hypothetical protein [Micromonospora sp. RTGN7]|uniref:hypothetical protein n=1 Tax=Micromonospora sp. RTGN7 TaxID=3016526 RepID=UPI0029FF3693|nr:hypothetical protein [Micromonospora sp. RTGN7]
MPTYAQLQAEPYWNREIVTPEVDWLGDELCRRTNRPRAAFGAKGDSHHLRGAHRSQEWIRRSRHCTNRTYTVQSGLTVEQERHIAGVDFTPASAADMIAQSKRLLAAMQAGQIDEVREFYGNVDGNKIVDGWDNVRDRAASSDSSHLWHWHLTLDRRHCRNTKLMERILAIALGDTQEDEMSKTAESEIHAVHAAMFSGGSSMGRRVDPDGAGAAAAGNSVVAKLDYMMSRLDGMAAGVTTLAGRDWTDEPAIVAGVLAGLGPERLAEALTAAGLTPEAIAAAVPPDMARRVVDELSARLAAAGPGQARE